MENYGADNIKRLMSSLTSLSSMKGKKLLWTEMDPETEIFYLLFEGGSLISVSEAQEIPDSKKFIDRYLAEKLPGADRVKELEAINQPQQETPKDGAVETAVEEVGETAPAAEPAAGGGPREDAVPSA